MSKRHDIHKRAIRVAIIIDVIDGTGAMRARLYDLDSGRSFECEERFDNDVECMDAGERLLVAITQKTRAILRLDGYPDQPRGAAA